MDYPLILLCLFALLAGFVDSVVGGGGLVQVPAFFVLYPQLSVQNIISTNRLASAVGTSVAAWNYARSVHIPWKTVLYAALGASICSALGATIQSWLPQKALKVIVLLLIVAVAVYTYRKKNLGHGEEIKVKSVPLWAFLIGAVLGFYNGFVGPGTGSLLVFGFVSVIGYNFLRASAISKIINVVADVSSLVFFIMNGFVLYKIALPMMVCNVTGSYFGSRMAMLRGNEFIRRFFLVVVFGIILRFAWDVFFK